MTHHHYPLRTSYAQLYKTYASFILLWLSSLVFLQGCTPRPPEAKGAFYLKKAPVSIPVSRIDVNIQTSMIGDKLASTDQISLIDMTQQWAREFFIPIGGAHKMIVKIEQAELTRAPLQRNPSLTSWVDIQNTETYTARLQICFETTGTPYGMTKKSVRVNMAAEKAIPETYTLAERKVLILSLYEELLNRLTQESGRLLAKIFE